MKQAQFIEIHKEFWEQYDKITEESKKHKNQLSDFPRMHRQLAQQYALALNRNYTFQLVKVLEQRLQRGNSLLYKAEGRLFVPMLTYIAGGFASDLRKNRFWIIISLLLFFGAAGLSALSIYINPSLKQVLVPSLYQAMQNFSTPPTSRGSNGEDFLMFAFYIFNNISISITVFFTGLFLSVYSLFIGIYNGVSLGGVYMSLYLAQQESGTPYFNHIISFTIGHASFEFASIIIALALALRVSCSIIFPTPNLTRWQAISITGKEITPAFLGSLFLMFLAAIIEAFWSASNQLMSIKVIVGISIFCLLLTYVLLAGTRKKKIYMRKF